MCQEHPETSQQNKTSDYPKTAIEGSQAEAVKERLLQALYKLTIDNNFNPNLSGIRYYRNLAGLRLDNQVYMDERSAKRLT